jgi:hypothetical protein
MDLVELIARRRELNALADDILKNTERPTRVKLIRLTHIRNEMKALLAEMDAALETEIATVKERIEKKNDAGSL